MGRGPAGKFVQKRIEIIADGPRDSGPRRTHRTKLRPRTKTAPRRFCADYLSVIGPLTTSIAMTRRFARSRRHSAHVAARSSCSKARVACTRRTITTHLQRRHDTGLQPPTVEVHLRECALFAGGAHAAAADATRPPAARRISLPQRRARAAWQSRRPPRTKAAPHPSLSDRSGPSSPCATAAFVTTSRSRTMYRFVLVPCAFALACSPSHRPRTRPPMPSSLKSASRSGS